MAANPGIGRLGVWDNFAGGHWGAAGATTGAKGAWGGVNMVLTRDGALTPASASRDLQFSNMVDGLVKGQHWAWGVDERVYFVQEIVDGGGNDGKFQVRRFLPDFGTGAVIDVEDVGDPIATCARLPAWTAYSDKVYLSVWGEGTYEIDPTGPTLTAMTAGPGAVPGGRAIAAYGERLMIGGLHDGRFGNYGNRIAYSEPVDPANFPDVNFFDVGADRTEIGGLYVQLDVMTIILADQQMWTFRGVPGGVSSQRRVYGYHAGSGAITTFEHHNAVVDPAQTHLWVFDHVSRGPARFNGASLQRVPGFGIVTAERTAALNTDGVTVAHGGPDDIVIDRVPVPATDGQGAAGESYELVRINGAYGLVDQAILVGFPPEPDEGPAPLALTGSWEALTGLPGTFDGSTYDTMVVIDGVLYVTDSYDFASYDLGSTWTALAHAFGTGTTGGLAISETGNPMYVSADNGGPDAHVEEYDIGTDTWSDTRTPMSTPRFLFASCQIGGDFYVIGGREASFPSPPVLTTVERYRPATDTWATLAPLPVAGVVDTSPTSAGVMDGIIWAMIYTTEDVLCTYDPDTDTWTTRNDDSDALNAATSGAAALMSVLGTDRLLIVDSNRDTWILDTSTHTMHAQSDVPGDRLPLSSCPEETPGTALVLCTEDSSPTNVFPLARFTLD